MSLETRSRDVQERTFCKWYLPKLYFIHILGSFSLLLRLNTKLEANGYEPMTSLVKDMSDGVKLIQLMVRVMLPAAPFIVTKLSL